ncbi:MAG: hypothetical protein E7812_06000 [Phenylobacterium sp.]|nr:MAG: hypothetical protein E7812_06000 [Phenylobacterium sp.]
MVDATPKKPRRAWPWLAALALVLGVAVGLWARPAFDVTRMYFSHEHQIACLAGKAPHQAICAGAPLADARMPDAVGGVTAVMCGDLSQGANRTTLLFPEFLGRACGGSSMTILAADRRTQTRIEVRNGVIAAIYQGPRHAFGG